MMSPFKTQGIKERGKGNTCFKDREGNPVASTCLKSQSKQLFEPRIEAWGS